MKKSLVALAVLGAFAGAASAQSSVTVFGTIDTNLQRVSGDGNGSITRLHNNGLNAPNWGVKGEEDLGGGLKASFHLEGQFGPDDGSFQGAASADNRSAATSALFGRRSTVSLSGNSWGEVRLGRDFTPDFLGVISGTVFGTSGSAQSLAYTCQGLSASCVTNVRASNAIQYFLPANLGGVYGNVMYAFGENVSNTGNNKNDGRHVAARIGVKVAGLDANVSSGKTSYAQTGALLGGDYKRTSVAASYTIGNFKPVALWSVSKIDATTALERKDWGLGLVATFGQHIIRAQYNNYDVKNTDNDGKLLGVGYEYDMSKRTALYVAYGRVDNDGTGTSFTTGNAGRAVTTAGGNATGYEFGVRHSF